MGGGPLFTMAISTSSLAPAKSVHDLLTDVGQHLEWAGERARKKNFRLLTLENLARLAEERSGTQG